MACKDNLVLNLVEVVGNERGKRVVLPIDGTGPEGKVQFPECEWRGLCPKRRAEEQPCVRVRHPQPHTGEVLGSVHFPCFAQADMTGAKIACRKHADPDFIRDPIRQLLTKIAGPEGANVRRITKQVA